MPREQPHFRPRTCDNCGAEFAPTGARQKHCANCRGPSHRKGAGRNAAKAGPRGLIASLVEAAEQYGEAHAQGLVERARAQVLKGALSMREALIRSRHENAKLRAELEVAAVGKTAGDVTT
jgi:hypothetical protein